MEILSQTEIVEYTGGWPGPVVMLITLVVFFVLAIFFGFLCQLDTLGIGISLVATVIILLLSQPIWVSKPCPTGRYEYKVTFDETYPITQLYEKYEIIGQDGKIWVIQDKEAKE